MAVVERIQADFRAISDGTNLSAVTGWDVNGWSGSGVPQSDQHEEHVAGQCIDMTNVGSAYVMWEDDTLGDDDQHGEVLYFHDKWSQTTPQDATACSIILRSDSADASDIDGYEIHFNKRVDSGVNALECEIFTLAASSRTSILTQFEFADEDTASGGFRYCTNGLNRFGASVVGTTITAYWNGEEIGSVTDSTYSTGGYAGWGSERIKSDTDSQPFIAEFAAWTVDDTSSVHGGGAIVQAVSSCREVTSNVVTLNTTPTSGNRLVAFVNMGNAPVTAPSSLTDDGTGSWTLDDSRAEAQQSVFCYSKESGGDETEVTLAYASASSGDLIVVELDGAYTLDDSGNSQDKTLPTTGTLSSDEKIGFLGSATVGHATFSSAHTYPSLDDYRSLTYQQAHEDVNGNDVSMLYAWDLGTATTAFAPVDSSSLTNCSNAAHVVAVYKKTSGSSPQTMVGNDVTIEVTAAAQSFTAGAATITGNAASIDVTAASKSFTVGTAPIIPQNLRLDTTQHGGDGYSASEVALEWDSVVGATGYDIFRDSVLIVSDHPTTSYNDTGLSGNTEYDYEVRTVFT